MAIRFWEYKPNDKSQMFLKKRVLKRIPMLIWSNTREAFILTVRLVIPVFSQILVLSFVNYGYPFYDFFIRPHSVWSLMGF